MEQTDGLKRTPLYDTHVSLGARLVPFAGWEMPVQYAGIIDETKAVRNGAGLFDVSHMGRVEIRGESAAGLVNRIFSSDPSKLKVGRARYGVICTREGGIMDDAIVYRREDQRFLLIPNASNTTTVLEWLTHVAEPKDDVIVENITDDFAMIAAQGPKAAQALSGLTSFDVSTIKSFNSVEEEVGGTHALIARTGYTGENGYELIVPSDRAADIWMGLIDNGAVSCGLGSRDVLRLEAGLPLHGNDLSVSTNPYEARLDRFVNPDRDGYLAGEALRAIRDRDVDRILVGFKMVGRGIARQHHNIIDGGQTIGEVTSGTHSPTLDMNIGLGYVPTGHFSPGSTFQIDVRGRPVDAEFTTLPFYRREKK